MTRPSQAAIVGIGQTEFSKNSGRSELQLAAEAIKSALDDAGLAPQDVDGLITFTLDGTDEIGVGRCLGITDLKYASRLPNGGAASVATIFHAMSAIDSGTCDVVVVWRAMNERSQYRFGQPDQSRNAIPTGGGSTFMEWCLPFGAQSPASWEALDGAGLYEPLRRQQCGFRPWSRFCCANTPPRIPAAWFYQQTDYT